MDLSYLSQELSSKTLSNESYEGWDDEEDVRYKMILEAETGSTRSHCLQNSLQKRLLMCYKANCKMMV
jgi:hypothetical protein